MTTLSPASTKARAIDRPIPRLPPVTSTLRGRPVGVSGDAVDATGGSSVRPAVAGSSCPRGGRVGRPPELLRVLSVLPRNLTDYPRVDSTVCVGRTAT